MAAPKTVEELLEALKSAPQDKEGAFRISTWRMVLQTLVDMATEIQDINSQVGIVTKATQSAPSAETIKRAIQDDLGKADANKVLF